MILYILRHGQAQAQITTDHARALTPKGMADTEQVLAGRAAALTGGASNGVASILVSPLVRAQQTAAIAQALLKDQSVQLETSELLIPEASPQELVDWLFERAQQSTGAILLVSHQPLVGALVAGLCGKPEGFYPMGTSSLAAIEIDPLVMGAGRLLWLDHTAH